MYNSASRRRDPYLACLTLMKPQQRGIPMTEGPRLRARLLRDLAAEDLTLVETGLLPYLSVLSSFFLSGKVVDFVAILGYRVSKSNKYAFSEGIIPRQPSKLSKSHK